MDLSVVGPLARSARDLALNVLGGVTSDESKAWTWHLSTSTHSRVTRDETVEPAAGLVPATSTGSCGVGPIIAGTLKHSPDSD